MLVKTSSWNPHALFLIYIDGLLFEWETFATFVLTQFWRYFVINVTIGVPQLAAFPLIKVTVVRKDNFFLRK